MDKGDKMKQDTQESIIRKLVLKNIQKGNLITKEMLFKAICEYAPLVLDEEVQSLTDDILADETCFKKITHKDVTAYKRK